MWVGPRGRSVREMNDYDATAPSLDGLRRSRAEHEATQRRIRRIAPLLLGVFVLAASQAHPGPGLSGRSLGVSIAVGGVSFDVFFALVTFGALRPSSIARPRVAAQLAVACVVFVSSVTLLCLQPTG